MAQSVLQDFTKAMGNKLTRHRHRIDDKYTRPQGLYEHTNLDYRKLKRLIINHKLAPCFPGVEDPSSDLDECPICFLSYPSLNRSKCCMKSICTECYLQIKSSHPARHAQCPFCKTLFYSVEYRGAKTLEEKGMEQVEEQKVIEAKIRIRQKELHDDGVQMLRQEENRQTGDEEDFAGEFEGSFTRQSPPVQIGQSQDIFIEDRIRYDPVREGVVHGQDHSSSGYSSNRDGNFDLENLMILEAIWLSIQDQEESHERPVLDWERRLGSSINTTGNRTNNTSEGATRTGIFAGAIAAMAERQNTIIECNTGSSSSGIGEVSDTNHSSGQREIGIAVTHVDEEVSPVSMIRSNNTRDEVNHLHPHGEDRHTEDEKTRQFQGEIRAVQRRNNWREMMVGNSPPRCFVSRDTQGTTFDVMQDHSLEIAKEGTSFTSSVHSASDLPWETLSDCHHAPQRRAPSIVPESFEEQIKLALALSLADAQSQMRQRG